MIRLEVKTLTYWASLLPANVKTFIYSPQQRFISYFLYHDTLFTIVQKMWSPKCFEPFKPYALVQWRHCITYIEFTSNWNWNWNYFHYIWEIQLKLESHRLLSDENSHKHVNQLTFSWAVSLKGGRKKAKWRFNFDNFEINRNPRKDFQGINVN